MRVDDQTFRDLDIFRSDDGGAPLFDRLDRTATAGGREALRRRYRNPSSDPDRIRAVQASVAHLMERPELFELLRDEDVIPPFLRYLASNYDTGKARQGPRASLEYFITRIKYRDFYREAVNGVQLTHRALRHFHALADTLKESD